MKISLLTLHSQNNNFGSVLQAYSLYSYLQELGHDVTIINYQPYYSNGAKSPQMLIKKLITNIVFLPQYIKRSYNFDKILKLEKKTPKYTKYSELQEMRGAYDVYFIGSDQVWNPNYLCGKDPAYTLSFIEGNNKISYAASIGTEKISEEQICELVARIKEFKYLSLRENNSVLMLRKAGRKDAEFVLDPVFLHDRAYYRQIAAKPRQNGYILAYIIHKDQFIADVVKMIAQKTNKKVIQIGGFAAKCDYDIFDRTAGPCEFLGLIDNADFVITSSFHGLAFSHIFEKQFSVVMPYDNILRLENILEVFGTQDRVIKKLEDVELELNQKIDYSSVNLKIAALRSKSCDFLEKNLKRIEGESIC